LVYGRCGQQKACSTQLHRPDAICLKAPDLAFFLLAAVELRIEPAQCLVAENAPAGIEAARSPGESPLGRGGIYSGAPDWRGRFRPARENIQYFGLTTGLRRDSPKRRTPLTECVVSDPARSEP
jgi:hypothetical protein